MKNYKVFYWDKAYKFWPKQRQILNINVQAV